MAGRNNYIDFLRFLGITLIVIAHVEAPFTVTQIRTFDVPLMVFVSGLSYAGRSIKPSWQSFYCPRIKRIIIPVYIFLTFYFVLISSLGLPMTWQKVLNSFLLTTDGSIGYVWIMRVFLLIMIITPLLTDLNNRLKEKSFYFLLSAIFIVDSLLVYLLAHCVESIPIAIIKETIPYLLGYSILFLLGLRLREYDSKKTIWFIVVTGVLFLLSFFVLRKNALLENGINAYKYPPTHIFILYGALVSALLWSFLPVLKPLSERTFVLFVGQNTIWIYLWHILFVILSYSLFDVWVYRYLLAYFGSISVYAMQYQIVKLIVRKSNWECIKYLRS